MLDSECACLPTAAMEGKEYPTRSKSGVRKTRTPWDNSSSLLFDEMVGVKRSPKTPPTGGKGTPSPKTSGKKTTSPSATKTTSKEKKVHYMYRYTVHACTMYIVYT